MSGERIEYSRRVSTRPTPAGKLARHQVRSIQKTLILGLQRQGYTRDQIAQVIPIPVATLDRRIDRV